MYDKKSIYTIAFPEWDLGDGNTGDILSFRLPPGMQGELTNIGIAVSETFAVDASAATIEVGTVADPDAYGKLTIPDATADKDFFDVSDDSDAIISANIAADALVTIKGTAGTDAGTAAGKGIPILTFNVWK